MSSSSGCNSADSSDFIKAVDGDEQNRTAFTTTTTTTTTEEATLPSSSSISRSRSPSIEVLTGEEESDSDVGKRGLFIVFCAAKSFDNFKKSFLID